MDGVQLSQGYRVTMRKQCPFYHSVPSFSGVSGTQLVAELTLEPPSGFRPGTPGFGIQRLKH